MNKEIKAKWLAALRSGKYQQGQRALRDLNNNYCCLGVLVDIVDPGKWVPGNITYSYRADQGELSLPFLNEIALDKEHADILIDSNDRQELSFNEIADWIEKNIGDDK